MPDLSSVAILMYFSYIPVAWFQLRLALAAYPVSNWLSSYINLTNYDLKETAHVSYDYLLQLLPIKPKYDTIIAVLKLD